MARPDPDRLLTPEALSALLEHSSATRILLVDVGAPDRYARAHVPGAVLVTPAELVDGRPPASGRLPDEERLTALFARLGLDRETQVIAYDDEGGGWAGRLIWTLEVVGHDNWAYLDGGLHAWHGAGLPRSAEAAEPTPGQFEVKMNAAPVAEAEDIMVALADRPDDLVVWDARSPEEYRGEKVAARRAGHSPGAVNLDWVELMDRDRHLRLREDLAAELEARGITPDKEVVTHCQTHHRSGLTWLAARLLGYPRLKAYHGSWGEWGNRDDTPITTGERP